MTAGNSRAAAMPEATVAAGAVRALLELAVSKGASRKELLERSAIRAKEIEDQDNRIPLPKYMALMRVGKELCDDPALALHYGEAVDLAEMSIVGLIGRACGSMAEFFAQLNRYARLVVEVDLGTPDRFRLERKQGQLWIVDTRNNANDFPELTESTFARMVSTSRQWFGTDFVKAVQVTHPEPPYRAEYDRIFRVPVVFDSAANALLTDEAWMAHGTPSSSRYVFGILSAHAEELLKSLESSKSTRGRVESVLIPMLHSGDTSMEMVARKMGVSRQMLYRKLRSEGTTFEKVLDELRHTMALHYLKGRKVSVNETAYLVGFSEPAAFSRAFKRWTGTSPRGKRQG